MTHHSVQLSMEQLGRLFHRSKNYKVYVVTVSTTGNFKLFEKNELEKELENEEKNDDPYEYEEQIKLYFKNQITGGEKSKTELADIFGSSLTEWVRYLETNKRKKGLSLIQRKSPSPKMITLHRGYTEEDIKNLQQKELKLLKPVTDELPSLKEALSV